MNLQRRILEYFTDMERKLTGFDKSKIKKFIPGPLHVQMQRRVMDELLKSMDSLKILSGIRGAGSTGSRGHELATILRNEIAEALMQVSQVFSPNQIIKAKGDTIAGLYVLADGVAHICEDDDTVLARLGKGDVIEEEAVWRQVVGEDGFTVQHCVRIGSFQLLFLFSSNLS